MREIIFVVTFILLSFIYNNAICQDTNIIIHKEKYEELEKFGKDSLNRRQGEWRIPIEYFVGFNDSAKIIEAFEQGFYINNKKEGIWEVVDSSNNLIAHIYYLDDITQLEILYNKGKIYSIIKWKYFTRPNNLGLYEQSFPIEKIQFNTEGDAIYRKFIAPDGIPEEHSYQKKF